MKRIVLVLLTLITLAVIGCNNFFHELLPSDDDRIKSFSVPGQMSVEIGDNTIYATVSPGTELSALIPAIRVDSGATVFPVTHEYTSRAFGDERTFGAAMELYTAGTNADRVMELIRDNRDSFAVPALDMPIDFSYPVDFIVLSARGTTRRYTVKVEIDSGEGKFRSFRFEKFYNPEVVRTTSGVIDTSAKTVTVNVSYPVENIASYQLTPSFETNGARVYLENGTEWRSGETLVGFLKPPNSSDLSNPVYGSQTKTLTLKRSGFPDAEWTLTVNFSEDQSTSRDMIDFRFTRALNPLINADYMAEIVNSGNTGTINVTVYYGGAKPDELKASFVSPGAVTVNSDMQVSGYSSRDFSAPLQYVVTSRVGNNVRTYTVTVNLVPASDPLPQITYFSFSTSQNPLLVSNSTAMIDHNSRLILIEAAYDGDSPPVNLIPEFGATGTVTVNGVTQTNGSSNVNFSSPVVYIVSNPSNPTLKREYRVEVKFVKSLSSVAEIETFSFYAADNPDLLADVHATVNQTTGAITATLLFDKNLPGGNRTLIPRWSAQGRVESNGVTLTSGGLNRQFYTPLSLRAISADSGFRKDYTVTVKEVNTRIYVRQNATGRNDGTNWQNAYRNLNDAGDDINLFPDYPHYYLDDNNNEVSTDAVSFIFKEIWIAEGTYVLSKEVRLYTSTSFIGGFMGNEAIKEARVDPANHRATINNGVRWPLSIIGAFTPSNTMCSVEDLVITSNNNAAGLAIYGSPTYSSTVIIKNVAFIDLLSTAANGGTAIEIHGFSVVFITDCSFSNTRSTYTLSSGELYWPSSGAILVSHNYNTTISISNCSFTNVRVNTAGGAICIFGLDGSAKATVTNCNFVNVSSGLNIANAMYFIGCDNVTETGNTFTNVPSPTITIGNYVDYW